MKKRKEYKIEITCADEKERNILFDIITEHELLDTLYNNEIDNENFHTKHLVLLSETLTEKLYSKLTGRVRSGKGWTDRAYLKS